MSDQSTKNKDTEDWDETVQDLVKHAAKGDYNKVKEVFLEKKKDAYAGEKERIIAKDTEEFVKDTKAWFSLTAVYAALGVGGGSQQHKLDRKNIRMKILRMVDKNILERHGKTEGKYKLVDEVCDEIKWWEGEEGVVPIRLPFGLHNYVNIYPGNSILISGKKDSGKTGMMLGIIQDNLQNEELYEYYKSHVKLPDVLMWNYYNCETPKPELRERVKMVAGNELDRWRAEVRFYERTHSFSQVMHRNVINILDYLDVKEDPFKMKAYMDNIHNKIYGGAGIAIVARQLIEHEFKGKKILKGYGGEYVKNKPRLVLQLTEDCLLVEAAKNPKKIDGKYVNINNWTARFALEDGHKFEITKELGPQIWSTMHQRFE